MTDMEQAEKLEKELNAIRARKYNVGFMVDSNPIKKVKAALEATEERLLEELERLYKKIYA